MSAIGAIEAAGLDEGIAAAGDPAARGSAQTSTATPRTRLQLVESPDPRSAARKDPIAGARQRRAAGARRIGGTPLGAGAGLALGQCAAGIAVPGARPASRPAPARPAAARPAPLGPAPLGPAPLRLTRRGRIVVGFVAVVLATVALTIVSMSLSSAQAADHGRAGAGYQGMRQVVVQPGQTLWSIASQAEPSADPRQVIAEIMSANSLTSSNVQAGELLWVPR